VAAAGVCGAQNPSDGQWYTFTPNGTAPPVNVRPLACSCPCHGHRWVGGGRDAGCREGVGVAACKGCHRPASHPRAPPPPLPRHTRGSAIALRRCLSPAPPLSTFALLASCTCVHNGSNGPSFVLFVCIAPWRRRVCGAPAPVGMGECFASPPCPLPLLAEPTSLFITLRCGFLACLPVPCVQKVLCDRRTVSQRGTFGSPCCVCLALPCRAHAPHPCLPLPLPHIAHWGWAPPCPPSRQFVHDMATRTWSVLGSMPGGLPGV
jgi:hypothetical protein